ncbi:MAG TPA: kelch repeat-containing protein [Candidatus Hydrogenedentes bacterium]|nr:kelch repeat-containing protein [Candidatus Hydrogenedentota bacterium]HPG67162.1 kelch repeat-containing protein [Candidatus Hydrogenedentota bacterium]
MIVRAALIICVAAVSMADDAAHAPQPEGELPHLLDIAWNRGPDLPQGFQDSNGGIIGGRLISVCGFCSGHDNDKKPGLYPRGFLRKVWVVDLNDETLGWRELPEFPGAARQGLLAACVDDVLYCWGGFSYSEPYCYTDGWALAHGKGSWAWTALPPLPWPISGGGACVIGTKIYVFGGADYDAEAFYTNRDRDGANERRGARLIVFDTRNANSGWQRLADCPGTPRWVAAVTAVGGKVYVIGGATGSPYCTVVDNWRYDPDSGAWSRLRDLPVASGNFPAGSVVFRERYIILGGGYQYDQIAGPDGLMRPPYGTPHRFEDKGDYYNDIFVYDVETGLFGRADSMPLNNNLSMTIVHGDTIYMIGGETGGGIVEGVFYGHHPELFLKGRIRLHESESAEEKSP